MKNRLTKNLGLKILSVLIALGLWMIVVSINNPKITTTLGPVPVEVANANVITNEQKVYEVLEGTDFINVRVEGPRTIVDKMTVDNIKATADMKQLTFMDTVPITLSVVGVEGTVTAESRTKNMSIRIEDMKRKQMRIEVDVVGEPAEGHVIGTVSLNQNVVSLAGPESVISSISRAAIRVDVEDMNSDIQLEKQPVKLYDDRGKEIDGGRVTFSILAVNVDVKIMETKTIPLQFHISGTPAAGYAATGEVINNPSSIRIAGVGNTFHALQSLVIADSTLDITGATGNKEFVVDITRHLPVGVTLVDDDFEGNVVVTAVVEPLRQKTVHMPITNIFLKNIPEGYAVAVDDSEYANGRVAFTVRGLGDAYELFDGSTAIAEIDVKTLIPGEGELVEGRHTATATVSLPEGIQLFDGFNITIVAVKHSTLGTVNEE